MTISDAEREELREYTLERTCMEFRQGDNCVQRNASSKMHGDLHAGCHYASQMLDIIERAQ